MYEVQEIAINGPLKSPGFDLNVYFTDLPTLPVLPGDSRVFPSLLHRSITCCTPVPCIEPVEHGVCAHDFDHNLSCVIFLLSFCFLVLPKIGSTVNFLVVSDYRCGALLC